MKKNLRLVFRKQAGRCTCQQHPLAGGGRVTWMGTYGAICVKCKCVKCYNFCAIAMAWASVVRESRFLGNRKLINATLCGKVYICSECEKTPLLEIYVRFAPKMDVYCQGGSLPKLLRELGISNCGLPFFVKTGPYGAYIFKLYTHRFTRFIHASGRVSIKVVKIFVKF